MSNVDYNAWLVDPDDPDPEGTVLVDVRTLTSERLRALRDETYGDPDFRHTIDRVLRARGR